MGNALRKALIATTAAVALTVGTVAVPSSAEAHWRGGGWGLGLGLAGLAIGTGIALAATTPYYGGYYPAYGGYGYGPYAYGYGYPYGGYRARTTTVVVATIRPIGVPTMAMLAARLIDVPTMAMLVVRPIGVPTMATDIRPIVARTPATGSSARLGPFASVLSEAA